MEFILLKPTPIFLSNPSPPKMAAFQPIKIKTKINFQNTPDTPPPFHPHFIFAPPLTLSTYFALFSRTRPGFSSNQVCCPSHLLAAKNKRSLRQLADTL